METKSIDELKPDPRNPRRMSDHDAKALHNSITRFGDLSCVVFNVRTQQLVGGHQRIQIIKSLPVERRIDITQRFSEPDDNGTVALGYIYINNKPFAYREVDWSDEVQRAANIAANRIQGEFDLELLAQANYELSLLENGAELLALTGQKEDEVNNLLDSVGVSSSNETDDAAPEVDLVTPPASQPGLVYALGRHRLMCADATDFGAVSDLINGNNIDLVFTDPPYGVDVVKNGQVGADFGVADKGSYEPVIGDNTTETAQKAWAIINDLGIKKSIIWGGNYFTDFLPASASWLVWDKRGDSGIQNTFADCELAWSNTGSPARVYTQLWNGMIREGEHEKRVHPTQKPIKMLSDALSDFSDRDQRVLDLFGGSGSTLIACDKMGRICHMMELAPAYCDVIRKRYHKHVTGSEEGWEAATPALA